tara:strand:+ start:653 stop:835 length:183 start_codon:yes stop_codon:yes gene_type:complete
VVVAVVVITMVVVKDQVDLAAVELHLKQALEQLELQTLVVVEAEPLIIQLLVVVVQVDQE